MQNKYNIKMKNLEVKWEDHADSSSCPPPPTRCANKELPNGKCVAHVDIKSLQRLYPTIESIHLLCTLEQIQLQRYLSHLC